MNILLIDIDSKIPNLALFNIDNPRTQRISDLMRWVNKKMFFWKYSFEEYLKIHNHRSEHREKGQTNIEEAWG